MLIEGGKCFCLSDSADENGVLSVCRLGTVS